MQTAIKTTPFTSTRAGNASRRSSVVVRAALNVENLGKSAAVAAAALALTLAPPAIAQTKLSAYQKELNYEEQLLASIKARTGKADALPALTASPTDAVKVDAKPQTFKLEGGFEKTTIETPAAIPTPAPAKPAEVAAPKPTPAPAVSFSTPAPSAPAPAPTASAPAPAAPAAAAPADNKAVLIGGGAAVLAVAAVAASQGGAGGELQTAGAPATAAAAGGVPANVVEARAMIAAWKKRAGKA